MLLGALLFGGTLNIFGSIFRLVQALSCLIHDDKKKRKIIFMLV